VGSGVSCVSDVCAASVYHTRPEREKGREMSTNTNNQKAGEVALDEIRQALLDLLALVNKEPDTYDPNNDREISYEDTVIEALDEFVGQYEGTYWYKGNNGWKVALEHPNMKPFDYTDWK